MPYARPTDRRHAVSFEVLEPRCLLNAAPVLFVDLPFTQNQMQEADQRCAGTLVSDLLVSTGQTGVFDADGDVVGIAIVGTNRDHGGWQYTIDGGASWHWFRGWFATARLLMADELTRVRFRPNEGFSGTIDEALRFRAWDGTEGQNGDTINAMVKGGETSLSMDIGYAGLTVVSGNSAPQIDADATFTLNPVTEYNHIWTGTTISDLLNSGGPAVAWDPNDDDVFGIAIVRTNTQHGQWQFTLDGQTWNNFRAFFASALLLPADGVAAIRFIPQLPGWRGTLTDAIAFRAWDGTSGDAGQTADIIGIHGRNTAFSTNIARPGLVFDAPAMDEQIGLTWTVSSAGAGLFAYSFSVVAVTHPGENWHLNITFTGHNGSTINQILGGGVQVDTEAQADAANTAYFPAYRKPRDTWTANGLTFVGSGITQGANFFGIEAEKTHAGTTFFIAQIVTNGAVAWSGTITRAGDPVAVAGNAKSSNAAPVLIEAANFTTGMSYDFSQISGQSVQDILLSAGPGAVTDADAGTSLGMAVVETGGNGAWQYSLDGVNWSNFQGWYTSALLLGPTARIRFIPATDYAETPAYFRFRAWDQTFGVSGDRENSRINGGSTAFSVASAQVDLFFHM